jgi:hypothetical protein
MSFLESHSAFLSLYHFLWQQQDQSVVKQGVKFCALDVEDSHRLVDLLSLVLE